MNLFLTGATGVIGGAVLAEFAQCDVDSDFTLLVRASGVAEARGRVLRAVAPYLGQERAREVLRRCRFVCGSLASVAELPARTVDGITHVLNLAANTSHSARAKSREVNVDQTLAMTRRLLGGRRMERFVHVSTAVTYGDRPSARLLFEDEYPSTDAIFSIAYAETKAEAERGLMALCDSRIAIAVPSIVVGHTQLGCKPSGSLYWTFRCIEALGFITWARENRIDVVPSDWVARALILLTTAETLGHRRYHVTAGRGAAVDWNGIARAYAQASGRAEESAEYEVRPVAAYCRTRNDYSSVFKGCNPRHMASVFRHYRRFAAHDLTFDNQRLLDLGMPPPPRFTEYIGLCEETSGNRGILDQMSENAVDM